MARKRTIGNAKNNSLTGTAIGDDIYGLGGNDTLNGGDGMDRLFGGTGNDLLRGGNQADMLFGGTGNDRLDGGAADDVIWGGLGRDTIVGGTGNDILIGSTAKERPDGTILLKSKIVLDAAADSFVFDFATNVGTDAIRGFEAKLDTLDFINVKSQNINMIDATQHIELVGGTLKPVVTLEFKQGFVTQTEIRLEGFDLGYDGTKQIFYRSSPADVTDRAVWAAVNSWLSTGKTAIDFDV
jgi:hypothetical protein